MAVQDLWVSRKTGQPTARYGRGLRYRVVVTGHETKSFRLKKPAELHEAKLLTTPIRKTRANQPVDELLTLWLQGKAGLTPKGYEGAALGHAHAVARWGSSMPADVDRAEVQAWAAALPSGVAPKAVQALAGALRIAVERKVLDDNPAADISLPTVARRMGKYLSVGQVDAIASRCHLAGHDWAALTWLLATTAIRPEEGVALDTQDVLRARRRLVIWESKSLESREVPIPASKLALLDLSKPGPLFRGVRGERLNLDWWRKRVFNPAAEAAAVGCRLYDLKHTAVSWAIAAGADVKVVQRMVGHKSAKLTLDVYGHLWDKALDDVADQIDAHLRLADRTETVPSSPD